MVYPQQPLVLVCIKKKNFCCSPSLALNSVDFVKVRLQVQNYSTSLATATRPYTSFPQAYAKVFQDEGLGILLGRGLCASMAREMTYSSVRMGLYDPVKGLISSDPHDVGLLVKIFSGAVSGAIGSCIANPFDLIKIRQQGKK